MRLFVKNLWREPGAWFFIVCLGVVVSGCISTLLFFQRADYQRRLDASVATTVERIRGELEILRLDSGVLHRRQDAMQHRIEGKP